MAYLQLQDIRKRFGEAQIIRGVDLEAKGGEISEWSPGSFDSFNPYAIAGNSAALASIEAMRRVGRPTCATRAVPSIQPTVPSRRA